jgi:hypothetical protein
MLAGGRGTLRSGLQRFDGRSEIDLYDGVLATLGGAPVGLGERKFAQSPIEIYR